MDRFARLITDHRRLIVTIFFVATIISAVLFFSVKVNYDLAVYLPSDAESTVALNIMTEKFSSSVPNLRLMVPDISVTEAKELKTKIKSIEGITSVIWLDDMTDLKKPVELADKALLDQYYKDGKAMFMVTVAAEKESVATKALYALVGDKAAMSGNAVYVAYSQSQIITEVLSAAAFLVPLILIMLAVTTSAWIIPLLVLIAIGVAVIINMGTNIVFGSVSFITQSTSPVLQLAVSLDYAIFLLNGFERNRAAGNDDVRAMQLAIKQSFSSVAASAITTVFGFLALIFMRFGLGQDLGFNLVKGVILSYVSAIVFLPSLSLSAIKLIDRTRHKRIIPEMPKVSSFLLKVRIPALIFIALLIVPSYLAQSRTNFEYGNGAPAENSRLAADTDLINKTFGESTAIVLIFPKGDVGKETELCDKLKDVPHITGVMAYVTAVGNSVPDVLLSEDIISNFYSGEYGRIILFADTGDEGPGAFETVDAVRSVASKYYEESWACGQSTNLRDMKSFIRNDSVFVNGAAILFIFLTLLFTFKSVTLPLILLIVIESAIWFNLAVPYFRGTSLVYLGYLVINTVQLGATIDYAILLTDGYVVARRKMPAIKAVFTSLNEHSISLLTSATILSGAGLCLQLSSSMSVVSTLGLLLFRGTLLSFAHVVLALPALLIIFDPLTARLTRKANFYGTEKIEFKLFRRKHALKLAGSIPDEAPPDEEAQAKSVLPDDTGSKSPDAEENSSFASAKVKNTNDDKKSQNDIENEKRRDDNEA